jgi:hypothetical protein
LYGYFENTLPYHMYIGQARLFIPVHNIYIHITGLIIGMLLDTVLDH